MVCFILCILVICQELFFFLLKNFIMSRNLFVIIFIFNMLYFSIIFKLKKEKLVQNERDLK